METQTSTMLNNKRIFIVEDDILNVGVFSTSLKNFGAWIYMDVLGYGVIQHIIESLPIDLIIMDIMLKRGNNGYDLMGKILTNPKLNQIPVVAVSALDPETQIPLAQKSGFSGFISKPVNAREFPYLIKRIIEGEKLWIVSR